MSKKQTTPKSKSNQNSWILCEKCSASISFKETEQHTNECPPNTILPEHNFILNNILYSKVDTKSSDPIKGFNEEQIDSLVYMSQSAMKLCNMAIGNTVLVTQCSNDSKAFVANVWPTAEKSVTAILLTKNSMDQHKIPPNIFLSVQNYKTNLVARKVYLLITNGSKAMELTNEFNLRIGKKYVGQSVMEGNCLSILYYGKQLKLEVKQIIAKSEATERQEENDLVKDLDNLSLSISHLNKFYLITETTQLTIYKDEEYYIKKTKEPQHVLTHLGGLKNEIMELQTLINAALNSNMSQYCASPIKPTRGVLLYGQSGTGKTHLAKALANETRATVIEINSTDLYSKYAGNVEENLRKLFQEARTSSPSLIIMDEIEMLCTNRTSRVTEAEKRIVSSTLSELDSLLSENLAIFVIATTNKIENLDAAFRRCGRFDREIEIPVPNPLGRLEILKILLETRCDETVLQKIAYDTHGFVGADLISLCSTASLHATETSKQLLSDDFKFALTKVRPSAMREVQIEIPNVKWSDIGGQEKLKLILRQCVEWPLKHAASFTRLGISPPRGVLMYGPPGCSKTMIAKALATESGLNFLSIKGPELFSKWVGESEKAIREVFRKARQVAPSIIFFDEIDALGGERGSSGSSSSVQERVLAQLLTELDGVTSLGDVTILAATNRPDRIDHALLRPGRLDRIVYVPLPSDETRRDIFRIKLQQMPTVDIDVDALVARTQGYSGAEVNAVCHEAAMMALEESLGAEVVESRHFESALELITPRTPGSLIKMYDEYQKK